MTVNFSVTEAAINEIENILDSEKDSQGFFRIAVLGGGCSGFQYKFDYLAAKMPDDIEISLKKYTVLIDNESMVFLEGSVLEFEEDLGGSRFVMKNPNASVKCGCGNSFGI